MENCSGLSFGDNVRVRSTPETESSGIAGLRAQIYGEMTPSIDAIEIIGTLQSDYAISVYFDDRKEQLWLAPELVEFVDTRKSAASLPSLGIRVWTCRVAP